MKRTSNGMQRRFRMPQTAPLQHTRSSVPMPRIAAIKPPATPRESWWVGLSRESFYAASKSRDWGPLGAVPVASLTRAENESRTLSPKPWTVPTERQRKELPA